MFVSTRIFITFIKNKITMGDKRGQIFIMIALVLIIFIYLATTGYNSYSEIVALEEFEQLSENYETEAHKVANKAIYEGEDSAGQSKAIQDFTTEYKEFSNQIDPNFGMAYIYTDSFGVVHIFNTLTDKEITIEYLVEGAGTKQTKIFFGGDSKTQNEVCVDQEEEICVKVESDLTDFGESFYSGTIENAKNLFIQIEGAASAVEIPLDGFKAISQSEISDSTSTHATGNNELIARISYPN
jgi:hypothetical protein